MELQTPAGFSAEDLQKFLEAFKRDALNRIQQPQEQPSGTEIANEATVNGLNAINAPQQQLPPQPLQQPQRQPLNPQQYKLLGDLNQAKKIHEGADQFVRANNPQETDPTILNALANNIRNDAHAAANRTRGYAKAIGMDLNGYENVSAEEAANKLATTRAEEIADLMNPYSKYGESSEQHFRNTYMSLIGQGHPPSRAKRLAGMATQDYQFNRVSYLRNAFNTLGRDGNYVNDMGVGIIDQIAQEMPNVANVYYQSYKLPTDAQDFLENNYSTERSYQHENEMKDKTFLQTDYLQGETHKQSVHLQNVISQLRREEDLWQQDLDFVEFAKKQSWTEEQAQRVYRTKLANGYDFVFNILGLKGKDAIAALGNIMGMNLQFNKDDTIKGTASDKDIQNAREFYGKLVDAKDMYLKQQKQALELGDDESLGIANERLKAIDAHLMELEATGLISGVPGVATGQPQSSGWTPNITGNWDNDARIFEQLDASMKKQGYSVEQRRKGLYEIALENNYTPEYAQNALGISPEEAAKWQR